MPGFPLHFLLLPFSLSFIFHGESVLLKGSKSIWTIFLLTSRLTVTFSNTHNRRRVEKENQKTTGTEWTCLPTPDCHDRTSVLEIRRSDFSGFRKTRNEQTMINNPTSVLQALKTNVYPKKGHLVAPKMYFFMQLLYVNILFGFHLAWDHQRNTLASLQLYFVSMQKHWILYLHYIHHYNYCVVINLVFKLTFSLWPRPNMSAVISRTASSSLLEKSVKLSALLPTYTHPGFVTPTLYMWPVPPNGGGQSIHSL